MSRSDRHTKKKARLKPRFFAILVALLAILAIVCFVWKPFAKPETPPDDPTVATNDPAPDDTPDDPPAPPPDEIIPLSILCAGDAMVHKSQWLAADRGNGTYDFRDPFRYVKPLIEAADVAMVNVETTFSGGPPEGYPAFSAPDEFAAALRWAGFDIANTCNNHMFDKWTGGLYRTIRVLRDNNLATVGSHYTWEAPYTIADVKGVRVGFVTATYETFTGTAVHALNGIEIAAEAFPSINSFRPVDYGFSEAEYLADLAKVSGWISDARKEGADVIVCFIHWGFEYNLEASTGQTRFAKDLADAGADVIFGSHPHVPQPAEWLTSADGRSVPVYYSIGNFISNQRRETLASTPNSINTEETVLARVNLTFNKTKGVLESVTADAVPCWLDKYTAGGATQYALVPLTGGFESNEAIRASGHLDRAKDALDRITAIVGEPFIAK